jgi:hypothetical protein
VDRDEALTALVERYYASHGPATVADFVWWSGLPAAHARQALATASTLARVTAHDADLWAARGGRPSPMRGIAYLLPPFDEYLLGYKDRSMALDPAYAKRVNAGGGMPKPTVVLDGEVVGIWSSVTQGGKQVVTHELFRALDEGEHAAVEDAARRYGEFRSMPIEVPPRRGGVD